MKDFASLIKERRSTRKFTSQLLNPDQVAAILKAGLMAPASKRKNPWQFVVVEDKEMLKKQESVEALLNRVVESKLSETLKGQVTLNHKAVSAEEFNQMFQ